jgi:exonuclease III
LTFYDLLNGTSGHSYDVVCITETWLRDGFPDSLLTDGLPYLVFRCDHISKVGGGCAIFVKDNLSVSPVHLPFDILTTNIQAVAIEIHTNTQPVILCCIYNPPGYCVKSIQVICNIVNYLCDKYSCVCILGDFNLHLLVDCMHNPSHVYSKITPMLDIVYEHSLDQIVTSPSRYASFLDLVFCTKFMVYDNVSYSHPIGNSDHCCQSFNIFTDQ